MQTPIIILVGKAGSGKDTVGKILADKYNAVTVGQADIMKRFVKEVFGLSNDALWGSSEKRGALIDKSEAAPIILPAIAFVHELLTASGRIDLQRCAEQEIFAWAKGLTEKSTLREMLMTLGTDTIRNKVLHDAWINYAVYVSNQLLTGGWTYSREEGLVKTPSQKGYDYAVITDGRFRDELLKISQIGGMAVNIKRDVSKDIGGIPGHASEEEQDSIPRHFYDFVIVNDGSIGKLNRIVEKFMHQRICIDETHQTD